MPLLQLTTNPAAGIPLYRQLVARVMQAVDTGALRPGDRLPAIGPLAEALLINPNVVTRAYRELQDEGVIDETGTATDRAVTRRRPETELEAAGRVQQGLLPQRCPAVPGLDYAGACRPARTVGGDYYDFIPVADGLAVAIGDVAGKGVPAALLMATLRAYLRGEASRSATSPARLVAALNQAVCESFTPDRFATFFYAHYHAPTRRLRFVNAGHNPPLLFRANRGAGDVVRLADGGPVLGFAPGCQYRDGEATLDCDDVILAFTDGITEAVNRRGDEWGEERLIDVVASGTASSGRELIDRIMRGADEFTVGTSQHDDMTLVALRVTGESGHAAAA
jgi:sigma-B regulation protein RsbU (phosphoserine phosphatase)